MRLVYPPTTILRCRVTPVEGCGPFRRSLIGKTMAEIEIPNTVYEPLSTWLAEREQQWKDAYDTANNEVAFYYAKCDLYKTECETLRETITILQKYGTTTKPSFWQRLRALFS